VLGSALGGAVMRLAIRGAAASPSVETAAGCLGVDGGGIAGVDRHTNPDRVDLRDREEWGRRRNRLAGCGRQRLEKAADRRRDRDLALRTDLAPDRRGAVLRRFQRGSSRGLLGACVFDGPLAGGAVLSNCSSLRSRCVAASVSACAALTARSASMR
jgi:hypothetical protein